jgi:hypothetical protein
MLLSGIWPFSLLTKTPATNAAMVVRLMAVDLKHTFGGSCYVRSLKVSAKISTMVGLVTISSAAEQTYICFKTWLEMPGSDSQSKVISGSGTTTNPPLDTSAGLP